MAFDAGMLYAVLREISDTCLGARVEKVHQPIKEEVVLILRGKRLSINIGSVCPRISVTRISGDNPAVPPMFCMLLRKHLGGAVLTAIEMCGFDRVCRLSFSGYDEMGYTAVRRLYAELMGKYSNLILTDGEDKIISAAKIIDFSDSEVRQLMPNLIYRLPPVPPKREPLEEDEADFLTAFRAYPPERAAARFITDTFGGTATVVARELVYRVTGTVDAPCSSVDPLALWQCFSSWFADLREGRLVPTIVRGADGMPLAYGYLPLLQFEARGSLEAVETLGALFDRYFGERDRMERIRARGSDLLRLVTHTVAKLQKKLVLQREELAGSARGEEYRRMGDLITASIYRLKRGAESFAAVDYSTDPPSEITVALDARMTPAANAQRYYKLYAKAKKAAAVLTEQIAITERELAYMESVAVFLERAETEQDLNEIRDELAGAGYAPRLRAIGKTKPVKARPLEFTTSSGYRVLCGRNNLQNELLTFRVAQKGDLWFHAKDVPGSHVILLCDGEEPSEADYTEAAEIAARHSSATGDLVAVDYTRVKNVKKPPGAKPGYVIYKTNYTAYVRRDGGTHGEQ